MKEIIYNITQQTEGRKVAITGVNEPVYKNNVLGIINKTQSKVLYTPLQYANLISSEWSLLDGGTLTLTLADNVQIINVGDKLFVKLYLDKDIDFSALAKEDTLTQGISSVASKVEEVGNKIDNIKLPEIDTTELAKQGDDKNATLTAIYKMLVGNDEPSQDIPEGVEELLALILEFYGIKPIQAYEFMTPEEVCSELEDIMTTMDISLTQQQAQEITNNTLTN